MNYEILVVFQSENWFVYLTTWFKPHFLRFFSENWYKFWILLIKTIVASKLSQDFNWRYFFFREDENNWLMNKWFVQTMSTLVQTVHTVQTVHGPYILYRHSNGQYLIEGWYCIDGQYHRTWELKFSRISHYLTLNPKAFTNPIIIISIFSHWPMSFTAVSTLLDPAVKLVGASTTEWRLIMLCVGTAFYTDIS